MSRREYFLRLTINDLSIVNVIIDPHYEKKHSEVIDDNLILALVRMLDGHSFEPDAVDGKFQYFVTDKLSYGNKRYKLIWLLEDDQIYIGVINAYRR